VFEVSDLQKTTSSHSHLYQDRALPNVESREGGGGCLDAKFENRIQYAVCGVRGVSGANSRAELHQDPAIPRGSIVSSSTAEEAMRIVAANPYLEGERSEVFSEATDPVAQDAHKADGWLLQGES